MGICLKYIQQCEKAVELQEGWEPKIGDWYAWASGGTRHGTGLGLVGLVDYFDTVKQLVHGRSLNGSGDRRHKAQVFWLPLQHQLQAMVAGEYMLHDFIGWYNPDNRCIHADREDGFYAPIPCEDCRNKRIDIHKTFTSMEQLWLGFVMKTCYNKVWLDGDWREV